MSSKRAPAVVVVTDPADAYRLGLRMGRAGAPSAECVLRGRVARAYALGWSRGSNPRTFKAELEGQP